MSAALPHRTIGTTGVAVAEIGFGGASLGNLYRATTDEEGRAAVERAWERGIRYFDTAPHYGLGLSERRLGAALREVPRDEVVVSTKVGRLLVANPNPGEQDTEGFACPATSFGDGTSQRSRSGSAASTCWSTTPASARRARSRRRRTSNGRGCST